MTSGTRTPPPDARDVAGSLWRALAVVRALLVVFAVVSNAVEWHRHARPWLTVSALVVIAVWSGAATWLYAAPQRRRTWVFCVDMAVAVAALLATPAAEGPAALAAHAPTVPTYWVAAPVLACAIAWGWRGGLVAALVEGVVDVSVRAEVIGTTVGNVFLLCLSAAVVGYAASLVRTAASERAEASALAAATAERERLAGAVHDGVLQVLAYVRRRGGEIGGDAVELASLAGTQEEALRGLISGSAGRDPDAAGERDVVPLVRALAGPAVSVAAPAQQVRLPVAAADDLLAAVREALANAARHARGAPAYVLVEDEPDAVVVSVRDDGPGIAEGRLSEAAAQGRLGIRASIEGRVRALGGTATLRTDDGGTEWELRVPRTLPE
ncbi:MAG TPA: DUF5931 domain-containing protein [Streptosporangiales bacterium]